MGVYNGAATLESTLKSVLSQEACDFEFVVVNDGSTDQTPQILDAFAATDPRLRVIHQKNTGLTRALVIGCDAARGEFIARQDVGDLSLPGRFCRQWHCMRDQPELAFMSAHTRFVGPEGEFLFLQRGTGLASLPVQIIDLGLVHGVVDGPTHHGSVMFRREQYMRAGGYRAAFRFAQDWDLWFRLAEQGSFLMLNEVLYQARVGLTDISVSNKVMQERLAAIARKCLTLRATGSDESGLLDEANAQVPSHVDIKLRTARGAYFVGECLRRNGDMDAASDYFRIAISNCPTHAKAWVRLAQAILA